MKAIASILWFGGIATLCVVASQSTSSGPAKFAGPSWIHSHF